MLEENVAQEETASSAVSTGEAHNQEGKPVVDVEKPVDEFKLPTSKEEYESMLKSAVNREKTNFLKELGVKSVKEYREQDSKAKEAISKHEELIKQQAEIVKQKETISQQYESLKQTSVLDKLGVKDDYREDLLKLAKDKVTETNSFESVLKELVETKYQYTVQKGAVKIGAEKTQTQQKDPTTISPELISKYPWLK